MKHAFHVQAARAYRATLEPATETDPDRVVFDCRCVDEPEWAPVGAAAFVDGQIRGTLPAVADMMARLSAELAAPPPSRLDRSPPRGLLRAVR